MRPTRLLVVAAVAATATIVACATHGSHSRPHAITVEVVNNLIVPTGIDVFIIGPAGTQWRLGYVPGGKTGDFSYRPDSYGQRYRLLAKRQLQRPIASTPFVIPDAQTRFAVWQLIPNIVTMYNGVTTDTVITTDTTVHESDTAKKVSP
jgi:hypothetical protein